MIRPKIIAICGLKRSGKDVIADYLVEKYGYEKIKFAEPLKNAVKELFGFTEDQVGDSDDKDIVDCRWNITPRKALQFFGTEVMQYKIQELLEGIDRSFFAKSLVNKITTDKNYVISDLRFLHEYEEIIRCGCSVYVIRIERDTLDNVNDTHVSEIEYKTIPYDIIIKNNEGIDGLYKVVDELFI
jgi:dephospho-CoA kinase